MILPFLKRSFDNGLMVLYRYTPKNLMAEFQLLLPGGQIREQARLGGLSNMTLELAVKGTHKRSFMELTEIIESFGGSLWGEDSLDYGSLNLSVPAKEADRALPLFAEVVLEASYPGEELIKEKKATLAEIKSKTEHPFTIAYEKLNEMLFGKHGYGRPAMGTQETVTRIDREDILRWKSAWIQPHHAILSIASPLPPDKTFKRLESLFDKPWGQNGSHFPAARRPHLPRKKSRIQLKRNFKQATLLVGFHAPDLTSPLYPHAKVLNAVLGGGMSARLFQDIREKRGLAYEVGSSYPTRALGGSFVIHMGLQASNVGQAENCVYELLDDLKTNIPRTEEVEEAKRYLRGTYFMDHQTNSRKAFYMGWWEILGKGAAYDARYPDEIAAVTPEGVQKAARKIFQEPPQIVELRPN